MSGVRRYRWTLRSRIRGFLVLSRILGKKIMIILQSKSLIKIRIRKFKRLPLVRILPMKF